MRDVRVEMAGNFRFDARVTNQLEGTDVFNSDLIRIIHSTPTAAPTMVPIPMPQVPQMEKLPTSDGLPPYVSTVQNVVGIAQWIFLAIGAIALVLVVVGVGGRVQNAAKSAKAPDHLERDGYRDYTQAVPAKQRHSMPADEDESVDEEYHDVKNAEEAPEEEASADAVNDAMAELYPEAAEKAEEATYTRRRKADEK